MFKRSLIISSLIISFASLPAFSATWVIADFNSGSNPLNIDATSNVNPVAWSTGFNWPVFVSTVAHGNTGRSLEIKYGANDDGSFTQFNFGSTKNIGDYRALSFWIKGSKGDGSEYFRLDLKVQENGTTSQEPSIRPRVTDFIPGEKITTEWQKVVIPISALMQAFASSATATVDGVVFDFTNSPKPPSGTIYIDDMMFHSKCAPVWVNQYETSLGNNAFGRSIVAAAGKNASYAYVSTTAYQSNQSIALNYHIGALPADNWGAVLEERFCEDTLDKSLPLDVSACDTIEVALQRGQGIGASINPQVELWSQGSQVGHSATLSIDETMSLYTVAIADLDNGYSVNGSSYTKLFKVFFNGASPSTSTCFIDQIRFVNNSTPTAPTAFLQNGQAITDGFTISTTSLLQVTADDYNTTTHKLMERVRFEHDGLTGGQTWYTIGVDTDTSNTTYTYNWNSTSLPSGTTYQIRAVAENINGNYAFLKLINCKNDLPPAGITDIVATAGSEDGSVRLTWTAPGENGTSGTLNNGAYLIKASTAYISSAAFDSIPTNTPYSFTIQLSTTSVEPFTQQTRVLTGLFPGTTYFFAIKTSDAGSNWSVWDGTSATVNPLSFAPAPDLSPNPVPSPVTAIQGSNKINLLWTNPSAPSYINDYSKYWVYMASSPFVESEKGNAYVSMAATVAYNALQNPVTAQITGLENYTTYFFHIELIDAGAQNGLFSLPMSSFSLVEASTMTVLMPPDPATAFNGAAVSTYSIVWSWADSANDAGYRVIYASSPLTDASTAQVTNTAAWVETGMSANTPYGRTVVAFNGAGDSALANSATVYTLANPPLNLALSDLTKSSATLTWQANLNPSYTRYGVSVSPDGYYVNVTTVVNYASALTDVTTAIYNLTEGGTYYFKVWAYNGSQMDSSPVTISTRTLQTITPSGFAGVAFSSYSICWSWNPVMNADAYAVMCASTPASQMSSNLAPTVTYYVESGLTGNAPYGRAVVSKAAWFSSALSNTATVYTLTNPPAGQAVSDVGLSTITVSWTLNGNTAGTRFGLGYSTDQNYLVGVTTPINYASNFTAFTTSYYGLSASTTYYFRIWTYNGDQRLSALVQVSTKTLDGPPGQPAGFSGVAVSSDAIQWSWADVSGETGYRVNFASSPSQSLTASGNLAANAVSFRENSLGPNRAYGRAVVAYNASGEGPLSASATVYTLANPPLGPLAVSNVTRNSAVLTWNTNSNPAGTRFGVSYSANYAVNFTTVVAFSDNLTANTTTMLYLTDGTSYQFRVWSYNESQYASLDQISVSTMTPQTNTPTGFTVSAVHVTSISWVWNNAANEEGYRVKYATSPSVNASSDLGANVTSWFETGLSANVAYSRGVVSVAGGLESAISATTQYYTLANPPVTPVVSSALTTSIALSWGGNNNPSGTNYGVGISSDANYLVSVTTPVNFASNNTATSATLTGLNKGTTYYIRVFAYNGDQVKTYYVQTSTCTLSYIDSTAPVITTGTVVTEIFSFKNDVPLKAAVTDDENVLGAVLNYRLGGAAWGAVAMTELSGGTLTSKQFTGSIPASAFAAIDFGTTIYYYVSAYDAAYNYGYWPSSSAPYAIQTKQLQSQTVSSGTVTLSDTNPEDGTVSVAIPDGALKTKITITIEQLDRTLIVNPPASADSSLPASAYEFGPSNTAFRKPVTLTLLFTDLSPKDGVEDNLGVPVKNLRVFYFDGFEWRLMGGTVNDYNTADAEKVNTVTVQTTHFSKFALFPLKAGAATFKPKEKIITPASKDGYNDTAQFDGLAGQDVKIDIFDIEGRKVRGINVIKEGNIWNGLNDDGFIVESGVYIFQFKYQDKLYSGTIVVAK